ncbi:MAG: PhzF family phenazine biosynthesis protein [Syntrophomonadaceae bacterium]|jgi:PhzF family phenazine biosynthesis protein|nr:PhzF family phenazine biosynthesis protein [Syntrophomonadaceae bacterium]
MAKYHYTKVDAFTSEKSLGNPAACIYLDESQALSNSEMLSIAKQHKGFVSEVVYCSKSEHSGYKLTYYSSECEVDFCGHGTIACMYSLIKSTPTLLKKKQLTIHTNKKGQLTVYNEIPEQDAVFITAPEPTYLETRISSEVIAENLGLESYQLLNQYSIDLIDAGLATLIVPVATLADEINVFPQEQKLKRFCLENELDIILIFSTEVEDKKNIAHTRVFAPKFGYLEDPATGSGNSAFAYYMLKNGMWKGNNISIEQGGSNMDFNIVKLALQNKRILFGGCATNRIIGEYCL